MRSRRWAWPSSAALPWGLPATLTRTQHTGVIGLSLGDPPCTLPTPSLQPPYNLHTPSLQPPCTLHTPTLGCMVQSEAFAAVGVALFRGAASGSPLREGVWECREPVWRLEGGCRVCAGCMEGVGKV